MVVTGDSHVLHQDLRSSSLTPIFLLLAQKGQKKKKKNSKHEIEKCSSNEIVFDPFYKLWVAQLWLLQGLATFNLQAGLWSSTQLSGWYLGIPKRQALINMGKTNQQNGLIVFIYEFFLPYN